MFDKLKRKYSDIISGLISPFQKFNKVLDYFEEVIKRLSITAICVYGKNGYNDVKINNSLLKLSIPSLGDWNNFISIILKWHRHQKRNSEPINNETLLELNRVTNNKFDDEEFLSLHKRLFSIVENRDINIQVISFRSVIDLIIRIRNKVAHGGKPESEWLRDTSEVMYQIINRWVDIVQPYKEYQYYTYKEKQLKPISGDDKQIDYTPISEIPDGSLFAVKTGTERQMTINYYPFIIYKDDKFFYLNGNNKLRKAEYISHTDGDSFSDTDELLKEQIAFFSMLKGQEINKEDLGKTIATSLAELGDVLKSYVADTEKLFGGDFRIIDEIGRGGMGIVYKVLQVSHNKVCAVKVLPKSIISDDTIFYRFKKEAETLESFDHLNIVEFIDFGESEDDVYLAMEYIDGIGLDHIFNGLRMDTTRRPNEGDLRMLLNQESNALPASFMPNEGDRPYYYKIIDWMIGVIDAVSYIHDKGIIHRDIKLSNIMIEKLTGRPVILDFGLAKTQDVSMTVEGQFLGTMRYASPEQVQAVRHTVDKKSDVYSLGAVLYEILTLRPLFVSETIEQMTTQIIMTEPPKVRLIASDIPPELEIITHKCLEKNPKYRYDSSEELRDDLKRWRNDEPIKAKPPTSIQKMVKWTKRNPAKAGGLAVGVLATILIIIIVTIAYFQVDAQRKIAEQRLEEKIIADKERDRKDLLLAVNKNDMERLDFLMEMEVDVNVKDEEGNSPLWIALQNDNPDIINVLLDNGADMSIDDDKPLIYTASVKDFDELAIRFVEMGANLDYVIKEGQYEGLSTMVYAMHSFGNAELAKAMIEKGANVHVYSGIGSNLLHYAALNDYINIARMLLEEGVDPNKKNDDGNTPLSHACWYGKLDMSKLLIEYGADVNMENNEGETPLLEALTNGGHPDELFYLLLDKGADVNAMDDDGYTPLLRALTSYRQSDIAITLIEKGADIHVKNRDGRTPLILAAYERPDIVKMLIEKGAKLNVKDTNNGESALYIASDENIEVVRILLEAGAEVDIRNNNENTPLHNACGWSMYDIAELLIEYGADVNANSTSNWRPIHYAAYDGSTELIKLLIDNRAEVNVVGDMALTNNIHTTIGYEITPLHLASYFGHIDTVKLLVQSGADKSMGDSEGNTAYDYAVEQQHEEVIAILGQ